MQAVATSTTDHHHVVAQTHYSTLAPCLDSIDILDQYDYLSYFHLMAGFLFLFTAAIPVDLSAVQSLSVRPVSSAARAAVLLPQLRPRAADRTGSCLSEL